jgi:hypothetical protein
MLNHVKDNTMEPVNFVYWLQGFFELRKPGPISKDQAKVIEEHLALTLTKKTHHSVNDLYRTFSDPGVVYNIGNGDIPASC